MKVSRFTLSTRDFGDFKILRPLPLKGDAWGDFAVLKGTVWGDLLPVVSGASLSHALHGRAGPLMDEIGTDPLRLSRRVPKGYRRCRMEATCVMARPVCEPRKGLPECYVPPNIPQAAVHIAATVAVAWAEGRYVLIVEGDEFSF